MRTSKIQPGGEFVFYSERNPKSAPLCHKDNSGVFDIIDSQRELVLPVHYSDNCFLLPTRKLEQFGLGDAEPIAQKMIEEYDEREYLRHLTRFRNGYPLVLFGLDDKGVNYSRFSLVFFGKEFNPNSTDSLDIRYFGRPPMSTYEEVLTGDREISELVCREFEVMKRYLEKQMHNKRQSRSRNREKKRRAG
jgi:hypothetical protein